MSSSLKLILLVAGLLLLVIGISMFFSQRRTPGPLSIPLEKNEGRLVAAVVPVPKTAKSPTPTPSASVSPSASPEETPFIPPTPNPEQSPTPTPTIRPTPTIKPTPTRGPLQTPTPDIKPTRTPFVRQTPTPIFTQYPNPGFTPHISPTPKPTRTPKKPSIVGEILTNIFKNARTTKATPTPQKTPKKTPTPVVIGENRSGPDFWERLGENVKNAFGSMTLASTVSAASAENGIERETIDLSYPTELNAKGSGTIELKLTQAPAPQTAGKTIKNSVADTDSSVELETDLCPPEGSLTGCFPDYETRVTAELVGSGFDIKADGAQDKPKRVGGGANPTWRWSIKPKDGQRGEQPVYMRLNFSWTKEGDTKGPESSKPKDFKINISEDFVTWGQISIAGLILSLLGPIMTLPWFFDRGREFVKYLRGQKARES